MIEVVGSGLDVDVRAGDGRLVAEFAPALGLPVIGGPEHERQIQPVSDPRQQAAVEVKAGVALVDLVADSDAVLKVLVLDLPPELSVGEIEPEAHLEAAADAAGDGHVDGPQESRLVKQNGGIWGSLECALCIGLRAVVDLAENGRQGEGPALQAEREAPKVESEEADRGILLRGQDAGVDD